MGMVECKTEPMEEMAPAQIVAKSVANQIVKQEVNEEEETAHFEPANFNLMESSEFADDRSSIDADATMFGDGPAETTVSFSEVC